MMQQEDFTHHCMIPLGVKSYRRIMQREVNSAAGSQFGSEESI
jgi:hypothetical protein